MDEFGLLRERAGGKQHAELDFADGPTLGLGAEEDCLGSGGFRGGGVEDGGLEADGDGGGGLGREKEVASVLKGCPAWGHLEGEAD